MCKGPPLSTPAAPWPCLALAATLRFPTRLCTRSRGSQTVSVEALDSAHVDPTPNASAVPPGDTVSYTIRVDWDPTFTVTGFWVWVSDTTTNNSTIVGNCARQKTCRVVVCERGHVEVNGI